MYSSLAKALSGFGSLGVPAEPGMVNETSLFSFLNFKCLKTRVHSVPSGEQKALSANLTFNPGPASDVTSPAQNWIQYARVILKDKKQNKKIRCVEKIQCVNFFQKKKKKKSPQLLRCSTRCYPGSLNCEKSNKFLAKVWLHWSLLTCSGSNFHMGQNADVRSNLKTEAKVFEYSCGSTAFLRSSDWSEFTCRHFGAGLSSCSALLWFVGMLCMISPVKFSEFSIWKIILFINFYFFIKDEK